MMLNCLLHRHLDAIFILPFVAVVQEKVRSLQPFADELGSSSKAMGKTNVSLFFKGFHLEEYAASKGRYPPLKRRMKRSLYVCTIEKANSLINSFIETERICDIGIVVVDEVKFFFETIFFSIFSVCSASHDRRRSTWCNTRKSFDKTSIFDS